MAERPEGAAPHAAAAQHDVLLATKLHVPRAQPGLVPRPRLAEQLDWNLRRGLLLVRTDPPLALARLRVRGQLAELRAAELRFTADEAAALLRRVLAGRGQALPDAVTAALGPGRSGARPAGPAAGRGGRAEPDRQPDRSGCAAGTGPGRRRR